jgi:hypothetical protein
MRKNTPTTIILIISLIMCVFIIKHQENKIYENKNIIKAIWYENKLLKESLREQTLPETEYKIMNYFNFINDKDCEKEYNKYISWKLN